MKIAGLVADSTGWRNGDWQHAATGSNALVKYEVYWDEHLLDVQRGGALPLFMADYTLELNIQL